MVRMGEVQQRTGGQHRQVTHVLAKVPQRGNGLGHGLNLVEEQQSARIDGSDTRQCFQDVQQIGGIVACECRRQIGMAFQIDLGQRALTAFGKQPYQRGLSHLSGASKHQWLPVRHRQPVFEECELVTVHFRMEFPSWIDKNVTKQGGVLHH